jgi:DNA replication protein DnaC
MKESLSAALKKLRLSGLLQSLEVRLHEAASHNLSHAEFLELLVQDELLVRADRTLQRRLKAAAFRDQKTLEDFDWSFNPSVPKRQLYELATARFIREGRDLLFLGPPGVGKSHLVQALGYHAVRAGFSVLYRSIFDVVRDFLHDEAVGAEDQILARYLKPELLIIDDMGMKQLPKRSGEYLLEIILRRYETRATVMTSNRPLEDWGKLLGDVPAATAILDRFLHHAEILTLTGKSYRLRHQARQGKEPAEGPGAKPAKAPLGSAEGSEAKPAKAPLGSAEGSEAKPAKAPLGNNEAARENEERTSSLEKKKDPDQERPSRSRPRPQEG